jgi:NAD(P)-dependent dehydrogenase (short-subunit alcohol dehydrogenase family)
MSERTVVVTGASTGIGWSIAKVLLGKGFRVFGSVRKQSDADKLQREFGASFSPLLMDVTDEPAIQSAAQLVASELGNQRLFGLVNNAGIAVGGPLIHLEASELRHQMEVNLVGPFMVTKAFAPLLGTDAARMGTPGRIVQISSAAGKLTFPFLGPYIASKHALEGMSGSLRRELLLYGIDVIIVGPGAVVTPIFDKAETGDLERFAVTDYGKIVEGFSKFFIEVGRKGLPAEVIGEIVYTALTTTKPKVRYAVVPQPFRNWILPRLLPDRVLDSLMGKQFGLLKK